VTAPASPLRERAQATYLRPDAETAVPAPRGKRCTRCLCCMAVISFGGESLCEACDDGTHPPLPEARRAAAIDLPAPTLTLTPALAPTPTPTPTLTPALAAPSTAEAETFWTDGRDARSAQADAPPEEVAATIQVNRAMLDGWWRRLSLSEKAALFTGELRIRVEGFVS